MALPLSVGDILALIEVAKDVYDKVKGAQKRIDTLGKDVTNLGNYLRRFQDLFLRKNGLGQDSLRKEQIIGMEAVLEEIKAKVVEVTRLLDDYRDKKGPFDTTFAVDIAHRFYFATGGGAKKLDELSKDLDRNGKIIHEWTTMLGTHQILSHFSKKQSLPDPKPPAQISAPHQLQESTISIVFIDKDNTGRSKVAEAFAMLVNQWTSKSRNEWPVKVVHSVGLNVKRRNRCWDLLDKLGIKLRMDGNQAPVEHAMQALFDDKSFNPPSKAEIRTAVEASRSRGPELCLFKDYDYILVFTRLMRDHLIRLREEMIRQGGQSVAPWGKGKIRCLGEYAVPKVGTIYHPNKVPNPKEDLAKWVTTVSLIQMAYKNFLKQELSWKQPPPTSSQPTN